MRFLLKALVRGVLRAGFRIEVRGLHHYRQAGVRSLIVANHTSYLDGVLFYAFLPDRISFVINAEVAKVWWVRLGLAFVDYIPLNPTNPLSIKAVIRRLQDNRRVVIFPEGRITTTGSLMKIYEGPALMADRAQAMLLPIHIAGAQYSFFGHGGRVRRRWFPKLVVTVQAPRSFLLPPELQGRARRRYAARALANIMTDMAFTAVNRHRTLFESLLDARATHGGRHEVIEDIARQPLTYDQTITRAFILGNILAPSIKRGDWVAVLLPTLAATVIALLALYVRGAVPVMLNHTAGAQAALAALRQARARIVLSSRRFVAAARLEPLLAQLADHVAVIYLEDIRAQLTVAHKLKGCLAAWMPQRAYRHYAGDVEPHDPAVVLFTSGTEGVPKGVVLSHANIVANYAQLAVRFAFRADDVALNVLPLFHSFGITDGTFLPLLLGIKVFFYPNPLHAHLIPELAYNINATILFGTNTFLSSYGHYAHPYDFYAVRLVFAGAERLQDDTVLLWMDKFGLRILEGYGTTETAPALAVNTLMDYRRGSVGRFLPGIQYHLRAVPGVEGGGRLEVRGPNVMLGYLSDERPREWIPSWTPCGEGWYDTGDIVSVDGDGYLWIKGRAKRFAKVGGEMISLAAIEQLAARVWPKAEHAAISLPSGSKGEELALYTEEKGATTEALYRRAQAEGLGRLHVPRRIIVVKSLPRLGNGKVDYEKLQQACQQTKGGTGVQA